MASKDEAYYIMRDKLDVVDGFRLFSRAREGRRASPIVGSDWNMHESPPLNQMAKQRWLDRVTF